MATQQHPPGARNPQNSAFDFLHLVALVGLAVCQPLFDVLSQDATFFVARGSLRTDLALMTVGLVVLLPLPLIATEWVAGLFSSRLRRALHLFWIAALVALILLPQIKGVFAESLATTLLGAAAGGVLACLAYARISFVPGFLTMLSPAPILFAALFLLDPSIAKLLRVDTDVSVTQHHVGAPAPVVLLIFDELPATSLMTADGGIDVNLFPNFARLASQATWFPNATANHNSSELAVPAILSGITPSDPSLLPIRADHPQNVFALLSTSHQMEIWETFAGLWTAPDEAADPDAPALWERLQSLRDDLVVVYGHIVLPERLASNLPSLESKWGGFTEDTKSKKACDPRGERTRPLASQNNYSDRIALVEGFIRSIDTPTDPAVPIFYFLHTILPHSPWEFLPTGEKYRLATLRSPGREKNLWVDSEWLHAVAYQRHLLQLGAVDSLLGEIIDRLHTKGMYDKALVIVLADHGISFRPNERPRSASEASLRDIANIPFFVKKPFQFEPEVDARYVETIDVLPTIADILEIDLLWDIDGFSVFDDEAPTRAKKTLYMNSWEPLAYEAGVVLSDKAPGEAKNKFFSSRAGWEGVYAVGPRPELVGRQAADFKKSPAVSARVSIMDRWRFDSVDPESGTLPAFIRGELLPDPGKADELPQDVAIAINGQIHGVTGTYRTPSNDRRDARTGSALFALMVRPDAFQPGFNTIDVYGLGDGSRLAPILGLQYELRSDKIVRGTGRAIQIVPGAIKAGLKRLQFSNGTLQVAGWAYDADEPQAADAIVIFENDEFVLSSPLNSQAQHLKATLGKQSSRAGFGLALPVRAAEKDLSSSVRIFAVRGSTASEVALTLEDRPKRPSSQPGKPHSSREPCL